MKLGVLTNCMGELPLKEALAYFASLGIEEVEIGCGGYPGIAHANALEWKDDKKAIEAFRKTLRRSGLRLAALACHGNPLHPNPEIAARYRAEFDAALCLAEALEVDTVVGFSGCPGDSEDSHYPNWVVSAWPDDFKTVSEWQWNEKLIPYWTEESKRALSHGVRHIALELHPGFCVYNTQTLLRLRAACGNCIGANFDPSHLFWQGIDPVASIRALKGAIHHVHAKDTKIDPYITARDGVLSVTGLENLAERPWIFRTVGYGHDAQTWRDIFSELRLSGYDRIISIEHEDGLMTGREGLSKAAAFLKPLILSEGKNENMYWA